MNKPLFSILIANYNNGRFFNDCYASIISQTYQNWEVIIVDDHSTDNSMTLIKKIIAGDSRFYLYENDENRGCGYTKRRCAELASGDICGFLDPDDAITDDALSQMVLEHANQPTASMVYSNLFYCDDHLNVKYETKSQQVENGNPNFFDMDGNIHHFVSYKKAMYDKTVGINNYLQRAVDKDLYFLLYEAGYVFYINKGLYKYRVHDGGISTNQNEDKAYFWFWVTIIDAAKRRNVIVENLFTEKALLTRKEVALQKEIDSYNKSFIFKVFRKLGVLKYF